MSYKLGFTQRPREDYPWWVIARLAKMDLPVEEEEYIEKKIKERTSCKIQVVDFLGKEFVKLHEDDFDKHEEVLNALLKEGYSFTSGTAFETYFNHKKKIEYTRENDERGFMKSSHECIKRWKEKGLSLSVCNDDAFFDIENYSIEKAKKFVPYLTKYRKLALDRSR